MKKTIDYTALADTIRAELNARHDRSAWDKAVTLYALDLLEDVQEGALSAITPILPPASAPRPNSSAPTTA